MISLLKKRNGGVEGCNALEDVHLAQAINYLEAYKMDIGLLINFGSRSLEFKRVMKPGKMLGNVSGK